MENAAAYYASKVEFFNCTTHGAFLKGWTHEPLLDRRLELPATSSAESPANDTVVSESPSQSHRYSEVARAIGLERAQVDEAAIICDRLVKELHRLMDAGENDVTQVDELEERLKKMLEEKGSILHFYTSRFTMALSAAMKSVTNLKENLSISAEYYHHVGADARKLSASMDSALKSLTSVEGC
jgi:DNA repair ATPase RecN